MKKSFWKNIFKKCASFIVAFMMIIAMVPSLSFAQESTSNNINVYVTVEKFTLGDGFILEPMKITVPNGTKVSRAITNVLGEGNYDNTGDIDSSFYLSYIKDTEKNLNPPKYILDAIGGVENLEGRYDSDYLGEFDYYGMSGWMFALNNEFPNVGMSSKELKDNDVVRLQFTIYGYGADLGQKQEWSSSEPIVTCANKDELVRAIADLNSLDNKEDIISNAENLKNYNKAYKIMENMESSQEDVDSITEVIKDMQKNKANKVNIVFDAKNGDKAITKEVAKGEALDYTPEQPTKEGCVFVGWYKDINDITTKYQDGDTYSEDTTYEAKYAQVSMIGAEAKPIKSDKSGIRFKTRVNTEGDKIIKMGTIIIPENLLGGSKLTLETDKIANSLCKKTLCETETYTDYYGTLINIPKSQFNRKIAASAYVIYQDEAGNEYTVYAPYQDGSVSVNDLITE